MAKKRIAILHHGKRPKRNTLAEAALIGQKLERLGALLQDPTKIEIVQKRYFARNDTRNAVFAGLLFGDNGEQFQIMLLLEQLVRDDGFDGRVPGPAPQGGPGGR